VADDLDAAERLRGLAPALLAAPAHEGAGQARRGAQEP
jgi:hypothetical protein